MDCLTLVLLVILIVICLTKLFLAYLGIEDIQVDTSSPVELESKDENSLVLSKKLRFYNEGKQCATIIRLLRGRNHSEEGLQGRRRQPEHLCQD